MSVTFSIITPTALRRGTQDSILNTLKQMRSSDELIVVSDGPMTDEFKSAITQAEAKISYHRDVKLIETPRTKFWGNFQRDVALCVANRSHVLYVDDDDQLDNLEQVRGLVAQNPSFIHTFNLDGAGISWPWLGQPVEHIVGACWVMPNDKNKLRLWEWCPDFPHLANNIAAYNGQVVKHPEVTMVHMRQYSRDPL